MSAHSSDSPAPRRLLASIALISSSVLILELALSRIFSVLFFYHYSFFAIGLVMSGLTFGGLWAGRCNPAAMTDAEFVRRLRAWGSASALAQLAGVIIMRFAVPASDQPQPPEIKTVFLAAVLYLPALAAAGVCLALLLARRRDWIGPLYAADLAGAGLGCLGAVWLMRELSGPLCIVFSAGLAATAAVIAGRAPARRLSPHRLAIPAIAIVAAAHAISGGRLVKLKSPGEPYLEKWNEHSRLRIDRDTVNNTFRILIDLSAGTRMPVLGTRKPGEPIPIQPEWSKMIHSFGYRIGRELKESAIIGVGGGRDLLGPLGAGAGHVDGFEINGSMVELLTTDLKEFNNIADWPEVSLIHSEGRVGIRHSGKQYDSIQASQIDTWAATAAGGFVLSENGIYTLEAWRLFLSRLSDSGFLVMTRWFLPDAPAEVQRLVALAVATLRAEGIGDFRRHLLLVIHAPPERIKADMKEQGLLATILVSKSPFTDREISRWNAACAETRWTSMIPRGTEIADPVIESLLNPSSFDATVAEHPFDISPPTDDRPFFFLLLRPGQIFDVPDELAPFVVENTMNAVRVLIALLAVSIILAVGVFFFANRWIPTKTLGPDRRRTYHWLTVYFAGIGAGYMFVQLGFHQRLILALGQPTYSLSVILFSMLLGGGLGSMLSTRMARPSTRLAPVVLIPVMITGLWLLWPLFSRIEEIPSVVARIMICGGIVGLAGVIMGFAFPIGATVAAGLGDWTVQRMWAINGATSILGSSSAAILGMSFGGRAMLLAALAFYVLTAFSAWRILIHGGTPMEPGHEMGPRESN